MGHGSKRHLARASLGRRRTFRVEARPHIAMVMFVHPSVHKVVVHEAVQRGVEHVVDDEQEPEGDRGVEEPNPARRAHDERRVPKQERNLLCEDKLDR